MNFKQYVEEKRSLYEAFAATIKTIIEVVLDSNPSVVRPQQIQTRAKSITSLARKLKERALERSRSIEKELKDLAGARLIFYTNSDERSFLNSRIIQDNFHVDYDASKVHHPVGTPADVNEQYRGLHYVISLKDDRLKLPEYSRFAGLRCEIQIQTILNHAWSETAHDILYHRPDGAAGFGTRQYNRIHKRMAEIMQKHLVPAGHEFEKVHHDFQRLMSGKSLFDRGVVQVIQGAADNIERCEVIESIRKDVLPQCDDVISIASDLRNALLEVVELSRTTETKPIEYGSGFGYFPGKSAEDVVESALKIITDLRFVDVPATFSVLKALFRGAISDVEREHILEAVRKLTEYHLGALRQIGPAIQSGLIADIVKMAEAERKQYEPLVRCVCENVLKSEVRGVSSETYDTVSLHTGAINGSELLAEIRQKSLDILLSLYANSSNLKEKRQDYHAASAAMDLPNAAQYGDALWLLVIRDTKRILEFFTKQGPVPPYDILQDMEKHCFRAFQNAQGAKNIKPVNEKIVSAYDNLLPVIAEFRRTINKHEIYNKYKTFVGFDAVFAEDLEDEEHNWRRRNDLREARMAHYLTEVTQATSADWLRLVLELSKEPDSSQHLGAFLDKIGAVHAAIAMEWLQEAALPTHLRASLLFGALKSSERDATIRIGEAWIAKGIYLAPLARVVHYGSDSPDEWLPSLFLTALAAADLDAVEELIPSFMRRAAGLDAALTDTFFLPAVHLLAKSRRWYWLMQIYHGEEQKFLEGLTLEQAERLLEDFVGVRRIDYHEEAFLTPIAKTYPLALLNMFRKRSEHKDEGETSYDAIPFSLHELPTALAGTDPKVIIHTIQAWYAADSKLFEYKGGRLLALIFPSFSEAFGKSLQTLVKRDPAAIDFIMSVLQNYEGEPALHETFKVIVNLLPEKDEQLLGIERALESTGVVSGEFGFVEAYQGKRLLMEPWLKDKRPRVRKFAERYIRSLDRSIAAEQRRAESDLQLRKHNFDPDAD
ncbi:hypothetical protein ACQR1I_11740 [Bradyrhizobium sp. HKCCYLS2038]|uniref:hypothetical protein n=1 Tax=unclassified Bradyrhizobium TaxID=2631580 RepID=UPI003EBE6664